MEEKILPGINTNNKYNKYTVESELKMTRGRKLDYFSQKEQAYEFYNSLCNNKYKQYSYMALYHNNKLITKQDDRDEKKS